MFKTQKGFSLVELMIVVGILAGLSLVVMNITKQSTKSSAKFQFDSDVTLTTNEINGILSDPGKCLATFTTPSQTIAPTNIVGKYYISTDPLAPTNGYGNSGLKVASYTLTGTAPNGVLTIAYQNKNILKGSTGSPTVAKKINVYIEGAPGAITMCRSLSTSSTDIWSRETGTAAITYAGNVDVKGTITGNPAVVNATTTIDFSTGNLQYTASSCGAYQLNNMKDGATYTFVVQGATSAKCSFTAFSGAGTGAMTVHLPPDNDVTTAATHTLYTFMVLGTHVYTAWVAGY